jgi:hypothetical protein
MSVLRKLKDVWLAFVHVFGQVQTTVLLSIVYHLAIGPIALFCKLLRKDMLMLRPASGPTYALELHELSHTPERAKKQF